MVVSIIFDQVTEFSPSAQPLASLLLPLGSNVDVCVITKDRTDMLRNYLTPNERGLKERTYTFRRGTTAIKKETIRKFDVTDELVLSTGAGDAMDTS